jgi:hypothetical protein
MEKLQHLAVFYSQGMSINTLRHVRQAYIFF